MNTIYEVIHYYDEDGGFGDPCPTQETVGIFSARKKAEEYVQKYSKRHAYAKPYGYLFCGDLQIREKTINKPWEEKDMWWLENSVIKVSEEDDDYDDDDDDDIDW